MVAGGARQKQAISNTRLEKGNYIADIILDTRAETNIYHWIVQRIGSPEVIQWGQEYTFEAARGEVQAFLDSAISRETIKKAE